MIDEDQPAHAVVPKDERFHVVNPSGRVLVVCRDEHSANEYAVLLNEAYERGYKDGHRQARNGLPRP